MGIMDLNDVFVVMMLGREAALVLACGFICAAAWTYMIGMKVRRDLEEFWELPTTWQDGSVKVP